MPFILSIIVLLLKSSTHVLINGEGRYAEINLNSTYLN